MALQPDSAMKAPRLTPTISELTSLLIASPESCMTSEREQDEEPEALLRLDYVIQRLGNIQTSADGFLKLGIHACFRGPSPCSRSA